MILFRSVGIIAGRRPPRPMRPAPKAKAEPKASRPAAASGPDVVED